MKPNWLSKERVDIIKNLGAKIHSCVKGSNYYARQNLRSAEARRTAKHAKMFTGQHEHRIINSGHNLPQESPQAFAEAILGIHKWLT